MSPHVLPVYVSSTWLDLEPERRAVERAVSRLREAKFVGMEHFGSRDVTADLAPETYADQLQDERRRPLQLG